MPWEDREILEPLGEYVGAVLFAVMSDMPRAAKYDDEIRLSPAELKFSTRLLQLGIRDWRAQAAVGPYYVDFLFAERLAVEIDGAAFHKDVERERRRDAYLLAHGVWDVAHIPASEIARDVDHYIRVIQFGVTQIPHEEEAV